MSLLAFIAAAAAATPDQSTAIGLWVGSAVLILNAGCSLYSLLSNLATKRDFEGLNQRVSKIEEFVTDIPRELNGLEVRVTQAGEDRAVRIHDRIEKLFPVLAELRSEISELRGEVHANRK